MVQRLQIRPLHERQAVDRDILYLILDEVRELHNIVRNMKREVTFMDQNTQQGFDDLNAKVANIESAEQSAETLLTTLNEQLQAALTSGSDPSEIVSNIQAISDRLNTDAQSLAAAVVANTPAASGGTTSGGTDTGGSTGGTDTGGTTDTGSGATSGSGDATDPTA